MIVSYYETGDTYYAMSIDRGNNRLAVASGANEFTITGDNHENLTTATNTTVEMLTLTSTDANYFGFQTISGDFLYAGASGSNYLKTKAYDGDIDNDAKWKIALDAGVFSVAADKSSNRNVMQFNYNNNNPALFSCYASASNLAVLIYAAKSCDELGAVNGAVTLTKTAFTITASWPTTSGGHETGYSVQLYDNNGSGVKGSPIGSPISVTGTTTRTCTIGAKTPVGNRLTYNHEYFVGVTPTYSGAEDYCAMGTEVTASTTTNNAYEVNYNHGTGATGEMSDPNSPYEVGDNVELLENEFVNCGAIFNAWSAKDGSEADVTITNNAFTMPASTVTVKPTWTNKQDEFLDYMHEHNRATRSGTYTTPPALSPAADPSAGCETNHSNFVGWVEAGFINEDGTLKIDAVGFQIIPASESNHCADGKTFYAVWGETE